MREVIERASGFSRFLLPFNRSEYRLQGRRGIARCSIARSGIAIALALLVTSVSGCGGSSGSDDPPEGPEGPVVTPESGDVTELSADGVAVSGSVPNGESVFFSIPPGSQIVLTTQSGDADLYLYPDSNFSNDNIVCAASLPYIEDSCHSDEARIARVYGSTDSDFQIYATYDCTVSSQNRWVDREMRDYYLFYDRVPSLNLDDYSSPEALIRDLRVNDLDPFSGIRDAAQAVELIEEGGFFGMGFRWRRDANGDFRVLRVHSDSPMGRAGVKRSDIIVSINGVDWGDLDTETYNSFVGTRDNPLPTTWVFRDSDTGETRSVELTSAVYTVNTVLHSQVITHPQYDGGIGYLVFEQFLSPSEAELDRVLGAFQQSGINDLILDLRYNGGGLTRIARKLMSQIAGPGTDDQLLIEYQHNNKYTALNYERRFEPQSIQLDLKRLVVLTTSATASASEIVINSLRPYIDVVIVGDTTSGKPYISIGREFCGKRISAMSAQGVNANGVNVFNGLSADCSASDDVTRDFGVETGGVIEGMVKSGADYLVFGTCNTPVLTKRSIAQSEPAFDPEAPNLPGAIGY
jgi:C-terminal processing protease CtpA/Prc